MVRVNDRNFSNLLNEAVAVLSSVRDHLARNKNENRTEIAGITLAVKHIQGVLSTQKRKAIRAKNQAYYSQKIQEAHGKRVEALEAIKASRGINSGKEV